MKLVLFDADGTLVDSLALIHEIMRRSFLAAGLAEPEESDTRAIVGLSLGPAIASMLGREEDDKVAEIARFYKILGPEISCEPRFKTTLFPGIEAMIHRLGKCDDLLIGMVTGKARRGIDRLMDAYGFHRYFIVSRCADDCPSKPDPSMVLECMAETGMDAADTIVVGDTSFDMMMAKYASTTAIGVNWGCHSIDELKKAGADHIVGNVGELEALILA